MEKKKYCEIVASHPKPGKEDEYNEWYDQHVKDVFQFKSMKKVTRMNCFYRLEPKGSYQDTGNCPSYITIYEFDSKDDILDFFSELSKGSFDDPGQGNDEPVFDLDWAAGYESGVTLER